MTSPALAAGELSGTLRTKAAVLVELVASALLSTIRLGGTVPAYGGGVGMGAVQDGITGVLNNILRADVDLVQRRAGDKSKSWEVAEVEDERLLSVQQGQEIFRQIYGTAQLSKLGVCLPRSLIMRPCHHQYYPCLCN